jgi:protein-S-isoprenylcysteine O-methyltransferase Ste14
MLASEPLFVDRAAELGTLLSDLAKARRRQIVQRASGERKATTKDRCEAIASSEASMDVAHKSRWEIAEVIFGVPFLVAIALQVAVPLSLPRSFLTPAFIPGGTALIIVGAALVILGRRELAQRGQPTDPGLPTSKVVTSGVFSISRNPLYLAVVCLLMGIALVVNLPWALVLLLPAVVACHCVLIAPEERYLAAKFGAEYRLYAASVHRWIGRTRL